MINMIFLDEDYFTNYGLILIEGMILVLFLFFFVRLISKPFINRKDQIRNKENTYSIIISVIISFAISYPIRVILGYLAWIPIGLSFLQVFDHLTFTFALMTTFAFLFYKLVINRISEENSYLNKPKSKKSWLRRFLFLICVSWIVFLLFFSINLLNIPLSDFLPDNPSHPNFDVFLLGFQWSFFILVVYGVFTRGLISIIPLEVRPLKEVVMNSQLFGKLMAFGIWSIQAFIVEMYLSRYLNITLYEQDIRMLALVVLIIYVVSFLLSMKYYYNPKENKRLEAIIKEKIGMDIQYEVEDVILTTKDLKTYFYTEEGVVKAVEGVSFKIFKGEVLGLVGETGCGKSVTALSILQLIQSPGRILEGKVIFNGEDLLKKSSSEILDYRGNKITMIFQDPLNSLNPVFTVGKQITEVYFLHKQRELLVEALMFEGRESIYTVARKWCLQLLKDLNIPAPESVIDRYPHELSGGMRQRIQIAMGIACSPQLLIADEPTTALDVTVQNQILKLMKNLQAKYNTSILFITHDLAIISKMCDRVAVMYSGSIVENGTTKTIFTKPYHPYTKGLLSAVPMEGREEEDLTIIPGMVPNLIYPPAGCRFHPRCPNRFAPCDREKPKSIEVEKNYLVACHLFDPKYKNQKEELNK